MVPFTVDLAHGFELSCKDAKNELGDSGKWAQSLQDEVTAAGKTYGWGKKYEEMLHRVAAINQEHAEDEEARKVRWCAPLLFALRDGLRITAAKRRTLLEIPPS